MELRRSGILDGVRLVLGWAIGVCVGLPAALALMSAYPGVKPFMPWIAALLFVCVWLCVEYNEKRKKASASDSTS